MQSNTVYVCAFTYYVRMEKFTAPAQLRKLIVRSGLSQARVAKAAGYATASGLQRYVDDKQFTDKFLPLSLVQNLTKALVGRGAPPITELEVLALAGINDLLHGSGFEEERTPFVHQEEQQIPIMGVAKAGPDDELFIEDPVSYAPCPPVLCGVQDAYMMEVHGDCMKPRYRHRALLHVNPQARPRPEDGVVVLLTKNRVLVKELVRQSKDALYLRQSNPPQDLPPIPLTQVKAVHKVVGSEEP